jgi:hypothetical protein
MSLIVLWGLCTQGTLIHLIVSPHGQQVDFLFTRFWVLDELKEDAVVVIYGTCPDTG